MLAVASRRAVLALALVVAAGPAGAAGINDIMKKFTGKTEQGGGKEVEDGQVLATKGDWTLSYDHAWSASQKAKKAICTIFTKTSETDKLKPSWVFYTRWAHKPDFAEFAINWGPSLDTGPAQLVIDAGDVEALDIRQGVGFLLEYVDDEVAKTLAGKSKVKLSFTVKDSGQKSKVEQEFSLDGFSEAYKLLFSECEPVEGFRAKQE